MKQYNMKPIYKIILCIIVSLVIDFFFLYAELEYLISMKCCSTFFGLFTISNYSVADMLYAVIGLVTELVVVLACKLLKLRGKGKKIFIMVHSIVIVGFLVLWYGLMWF